MISTARKIYLTAFFALLNSFGVNIPRSTVTPPITNPKYEPVLSVPLKSGIMNIASTAVPVTMSVYDSILTGFDEQPDILIISLLTLKGASLLSA